MALTSDQITAQNFKDFFDVIKPYLGYVNAGFTPVGTVISVMGNSAPQNYLECNGQTVNILDYPELAAYFTAQFGAVDNFGGDGTTTFGIPDLRGEFLRGTGTNGHSGEGDGANVGVHQAATTIPNIGYEYVSNEGRISLSRGASSSVPVSNKDKETGASDAKKCYAKGTFDTMGSSGNSSYTTRPTNTSVLYCIAYKDIYVDARYDYRLTEKVVGTWIDGKPLYQKTVELANQSYAANTVTTITVIASGIDNLVDCYGRWTTSSSSIQFPFTNADGIGVVLLGVVPIQEGNSCILRVARKGTAGTVNITATVVYTKTTD